MTAAQRKARNLKLTSGCTFYVAAATTAAANVYASQRSVLGVCIGLWTPLAFFLSLELLERMPSKGNVGKLRVISISVLALIAGWESYWHLVHVLTQGGAGMVGRYAMPLTVDILMVISRMAMNHKTSLPRSSRRPAAKAKVAPVRKLRSA